METEEEKSEISTDKPIEKIGSKKDHKYGLF